MNNFKVLKEKITGAPDSAGVYLMQDSRGRVIYIGKAKSLKKRLLSYLGRDLASKTVALMRRVRDIKYEICPNESLALLLEANLIRKYKPRYNISLRDDKSFPYVKITREEFPALSITRKRESDRARYLGPYTNVKLLKGALKIIRCSFPYRSCKNLPQKPCIYYRLRLCPGACVRGMDRVEYGRIIRDVAFILEGKVGKLIEDLSRDMRLKSQALDFEAAAKRRDQINALSAIGRAKEGLNSQDELQDLKELLRLKNTPERIEAFDISNISGQEACGALVSFFQGRPDKSNYRRFRIKGVLGVNDYGMLAEVIGRRYLRLIKEGSGFPDLILIDGGRAHLLTAAKELTRLKLIIPLVSIAKEEEHIYTQRRHAPLRLDADTPALNLIRRIRDEAHRFAISYHHLLRHKKIIAR